MSQLSFTRRKTSIVRIGDIPMGCVFPIRIQSMTNTPTLDTETTVEQCKRIFDAGADYVRITTPAIRDAENLEHIKKELHAAGYKKPLVADVHFNPAVAEVAARIVEKVRINPGNYVDKKKFETFEYTDTEYTQEIERIHQRVLPLLSICKEYGTAIRIGVNHGSLSDRIMSRYGDTPEGMAESAMEFLRIFEAEGFKQTVISMKSSNTRIMVYSTRLLVEKMAKENMHYPVHLGVTEAGEGEDGRIKSAVGIGTLLAEGIGDTIRVSLTEAPEAEIPVATQLVNHFNIPSNKTEHEDTLSKPTEYLKYNTKTIVNIGGNSSPVVIADLPEGKTKFSSSPEPDYLYFFDHGNKITLHPQYNYITSMKRWFVSYKEEQNCFPLMTDAEFIFYGEKSDKLNFVTISAPDIRPELTDALKKAQKTVLIIETFNPNRLGFQEQNLLIEFLKYHKINAPFIINRNYSEDELCSLQIKASSDIGAHLIDGFGDGIWLRNAGDIPFSNLVSAAFGILQASRVRTTKTEYISCPSCGRTLFDLTTTTAKIREKTAHLKHLKIGIMGCIVNGPGEMADADYGYVGAGPGKINLYKKKEVVKRNIPEAEAVQELINLIKLYGEWFDA
ncbi:MAG TPA: (E)-4-hydroxy-3-methylbut-2-enyl-diphosphate synthase [Bacteroidales bacterium]|nr:(E)-4-hydroxy-3-methylbut-2-enyl-diphosphate synthase [Bacteroidales bacterium]